MTCDSLLTFLSAFVSVLAHFFLSLSAVCATLVVVGCFLRGGRRGSACS